MSAIENTEKPDDRNGFEWERKFKTYWSANPFKMYSHIPRLYEWYMGNEVYPISIEISLTSQCNHNCSWCSVKPKNIERHSHLSRAILDQFVRNIKEMDVRSVVISGSGEQTLHAHFCAFLNDLKQAGINIGLNTNGSRLTEQICQAIVNTVTWVRVSLDAATEDTRKAIHGVSDLHKVVEGLERLAFLKRQKSGRFSIGTQMVVCPENGDEIESCAQLSASIGVDYHQIKPVAPFDFYYPNRPNAKLEMETWLKKIKTAATQLSRDGFTVIVRYDQFLDYIEGGTSKREKAHIPCFTTFSPYVEADGNVWYCVDRKGYDEYLLGNLNTDSLKTIWHSEKRKAVLSFVSKHPCDHICRNSPLNEFLWGIKNPTPFHDFL